MFDDRLRRQILFGSKRPYILENAVSLDSHTSESFPTPTHWWGRYRANSVTRFDLARTSTLRHIEYSASRQWSLPKNRDCQQTATHYLLYQSRAYTEHQIFFAFHKLLKRCMKAQQVVQCMVPRALFGGVRNTSKSVYSSDSQLLLSRPSGSGAYLRSVCVCACVCVYLLNCT